MAGVKRGRLIKHLALDYGALIPFIIFALFPIYFMFLTSFRVDAELYDLESIPFIFNQPPTLGHYTYIFTKTKFPYWITNSIIVSVLSTGISIPISILAAYSVARLRFKGAATFGIAIFVTYLVPPTLLFVPLTRIMYKLNLADTIWSLVITYPTFLIPFATWLLMGYFRTIPREIEECAMVDGCSRMGVLLRIVLPVSIPGIVCAVLFAFTLAWNEFIYAYSFISSSTQKVVAPGVVTELIRGDVFHWGEIMAGAFIGALPIVIFYVFFLDYYVSGMTAGAVKG
ncbi:MAG: carbohydrate ABC transporter permease [Deltaproteobacteria bacterium]|nr:carbohydrate ABC transporter permease [Deltaproteobacteria bacterium]